MNEVIRDLKNYLDHAHSTYHAIDGLAQMLETEGYICLSEADAWNLVPGGRYYMTRGLSSMIAFRIPETDPTGFMIGASHSDRCSFKLKENGELTGKYTRVSVEKYGGSILSTWLDRPLSVAGRVVVETETGIESRLVDIDRDLLLIPNVAIHMDRSINDGKKWNVATDMLPLAGDVKQQGRLTDILTDAAGGKILGSDLFLYPRQDATVWGVAEEFISASVLDDLACTWSSAQGFLAAEDSCAIPMLCVFDSEEVGSGSMQGAGSQVLADVLKRICRCLELDFYRMISQSFMLSADGAHAVHPNHPEYADSGNAPVLNGGVILKYSAGLKYTTDGVSAGVFKKLCADAGIPVQVFYNRADLPGGTTLARISVGHVSIPSADIGLPLLAMHSCYETAGVQDVSYMVDAMRVFFGTDLEFRNDGSFDIGQGRNNW